MILYRVLDNHIVGTAHNTVFRRHLCEWVLPQQVANKVRFNPNHLPVVTETRHEMDYGLFAGILRILRGYRVQSRIN